jgi:hypothetical protein
MGESCGSDDGDKKYIQNFGGETFCKTNTCETEMMMGE